MAKLSKAVGFYKDDLAERSPRSAAEPAREPREPRRRGERRRYVGKHRAP